MTKENETHKAEGSFQYGLIWLIRLSLITAAFLSVYLGEWESAFITILALVLTGLPNLIERRYKLQLPVEYDLIIAVFIYASIFLGEVGDAYARFWWWDGLLHTSSGVVLAFVGFLLLHSLYQRGKLAASPFLLASFAFSFSLAAGALWEIFEFTMDALFELNLQKSGLKDTMADLTVDAAGAFVVARLAYNYVKNGRSGLLARFVDSFLKYNPQLLRRRASRG